MVAYRGLIGKGVEKNLIQISPYLCGILLNSLPILNSFHNFSPNLSVLCLSHTGVEENVCNTLELVRVDLLGS